MFSQACVIPSVHGGGGVSQHAMGQSGVVDTHLGRQPPSGQTPPPRETATEAGGTHPTGMHSCSN